MCVFFLKKTHCFIAFYSKLSNEFMDCDGSISNVENMCGIVNNFLENNSDSGYNFVLVKDSCNNFEQSGDLDSTDLQILVQGCKVRRRITLDWQTVNYLKGFRLVYSHTNLHVELGTGG